MSLWNDEKATGGSGPTKAGATDAWPKKENPGTSKGTPSGAPAGRASGGGISRDDYWANREARDLEKERVYREVDIPAMRRSAAYQVGAKLVAAAVGAEALSFGSVSQGKKWDMMLEYLDHAVEHVLNGLNGVVEAEESVDVDAEAAAEQQQMTEEV